MEPEHPSAPDDAPAEDLLPTGARRCTAHSRNGKRCGNPAIKGASVCRSHGGSAPQVKRKAALRLLELIDPAITVLAREMIQADRSADRQRAANSVLDRAGVPRATTSPDGEAARDLLVERLRQIREEQEYPITDDDSEDPQ